MCFKHAIREELSLEGTETKFVCQNKNFLVKKMVHVPLLFKQTHHCHVSHILISFLYKNLFKFFLIPGVKLKVRKLASEVEMPKAKNKKRAA